MSRYLDTFTRTSGSSISSAYTELSSSASASWKTTGSVAESLTANTNLALLGTSLGPTTPDQYAAVTLPNNLGTSSGIQARCTATAVSDQSGYRWRATQTVVTLFKVVAGAATNIGEITRTRAAGDRLGLVVTGDGAATPVTIVGYVNGVEAVRFVDTSSPITAVGRTGLVNASTVGVQYDDFATGDYTYADASGVNGIPAPPQPAAAKVTGVTVTDVTATGFTVTWSAAANADSYSVAVTPSGGSTVSKTVTGATTTVISGLSPSTPYTVVVTGVNTAGAGPSSDSVSQMTSAPPATAPATPTAAPVVGAAAQSTLALSWPAAATASSYTVEYRVVGATAWTAVTGITGTSTTLTGLTAGTNYEVRYYAVNNVGPSGASPIATASTLAAPVTGPNPVNADGIPRWRGLIFNLAGEMIVAGGSVMHRQHAEFIGLVNSYVLPDWLTVPAGSAAIVGGAGRVLELTTAATVGAKATLQMAVPLTTAEIGAVLIELRHMSFSVANPNADWRLFFTDGAAVGASALHLAGTDTVVLASQGEASTTTTPQAVLGEHAARRRHSGLLVSTATKEVWLMQEGSVVAYRDCSAAWSEGTANLGLSITAQAATAAKLRLASLTVTVYSRDLV